MVFLFVGSSALTEASSPRNLTIPQLLLSSARDARDRTRFLEILGETCARTGWEIHAFCLMGTHFHLVVETPEPNLVNGMRWILGKYGARFNRRHKLMGPMGMAVVLLEHIGVT
jgi:hypothetical protein